MSDNHTQDPVDSLKQGRLLYRSLPNGVQYRRLSRLALTAARAREFP
jgi:hypothetical protein